MAEPAYLGVKPAGSSVSLAFLVTPVCRYTVFRNMVHFPGTNLNFNRLSLGSDNGSMQRLIQIGLRHRNIILETVWQRFPERVSQTKYGIALWNGIYNDTDSIQIVYLRQILMLFFHLLINTVEMLWSSGYLGFNSRFIQMFLQHFHCFFNDFFSGSALLFHLADQIFIFLRMEVMETQIFQFPLNVINPETMCQWSINFQCFSGYTLLFFPAENSESTHIVQTVSQLDNHYADILGHGQEHLTEIFSLLILFVRIVEAGQLGYPIHQKSDFFAKHLRNIFPGIFRILYHIMQQSRNHPRQIHLQFGQNIGYRQRMNNIRFPRFSYLFPMSLSRQVISFINPFQCLGILVIRLHLSDETVIFLFYFERKIMLFGLFLNIVFLINQKICQRRRRCIRMNSFIIQRL